MPLLPRGSAAYLVDSAAARGEAHAVGIFKRLSDLGLSGESLIRIPIREKRKGSAALLTP